MKSITLILLILALAAPVGQVAKASLITVQEATATGSDAGAGDNGGFAVAISGDTLVVGAPYGPTNTSIGAAYVFERNAGGADHWGQVKKLTASDAAAGDQFGFAVAVDSNTVVVAAATKNSTTGAAYVFERNAGGAENWGQVKKLTASDAAFGDAFGISLALSGDTLVAGAALKNSSTGAAYVFGRNFGGSNNWGQVKQLLASDAAASSEFGNAVTLSGDTLVVTADIKNSNVGGAYVFERNAGGADHWGQVKILTASDAVAGDYFGFFASLDGDTAIVGAPLQGSFAGAAYLFGRNTGGSNNWGQLKKIVSNDAPEADEFGFSIALSGDSALVGAPLTFRGTNYSAGTAYLFERDAGGADNWGEAQVLVPNNDPGSVEAGWAVAITANSLVVGAPSGNGGTGAAYVFALSPGGCGLICQSRLNIPASGCQDLTTVDYPGPTLSGDCAGISTNCTPPSGLMLPAGPTEVLCTATDGLGNTNVCRFTVVVIASLPPVAFCRNVTTNICDTGMADVPAAAVDDGSYDSLGNPITLSLTPPGPYTPGDTAVILTVANNVGCTNTCTAIITVLTNPVPPTISCPADMHVSVAAGVSNAVVNYAISVSDACGIASTNCLPPSGSAFPLGGTQVACTAVNTAGLTNICAFIVTVEGPPPVPHDLALLSIHAPKNINLKAATPALTKRVKVQIQNLSAHSETITNLTVLGNLVSVTLSNLHTSCTPPTADLIQGPPNVVPRELKPKKKLNVFFNVSYSTNCVPDRMKGTGHEDFSYAAHVNHAALDGNADTMPANDDCPRAASGSDKGCAPVLTDVFVK